MCVIKVSGKMDKSGAYKKFSSDISFFIQEFLQTKHFFSFSTFKHLRK